MHAGRSRLEQGAALQGAPAIGRELHHSRARPHPQHVGQSCAASGCLLAWHSHVESESRFDQGNSPGQQQARSNRDSDTVAKT